MSYRESRRYCRPCRRITVHWRPWTSWKEAEPPVGWEVPVRAVTRAFNRLFGRHRWRCLECDHPWDSSLLHGVRQPASPLKREPEALPEPQPEPSPSNPST